MKRATETTIFALGAMLIAAGCAAGHPAVEDSEPGAVTTSDTLVGTVRASSAASESGPAAQICSPGETRECKTYWTDSRGQLHCMVQGQACRADGHAWQVCGDMDAGFAPDAGSDDASSDTSPVP